MWRFFVKSRKVRASWRVHQLYKERFECQVCKKFFTRKHVLKVHVETHNGTRPFECLDCGKRFKTKINLKKHSLVHNDSMDFKCKICQKRFKRSKELEAHLRLHEDKKEFECKVCGKSFKTKKGLNFTNKASIKQRGTSSVLNPNQMWNLQQGIQTLKRSKKSQISSLEKQEI